MPAARQASSSSVARPKIAGSPPFRRTTRSPAKRCLDDQRVDRSLILRMAPGALADGDQPRVSRTRGRARPGRPAHRRIRRWPRAISFSALRVSRSGSPGPAPTSHTSPGAITSLMPPASLSSRNYAASRPAMTGRHEPQLVPACVAGTRFTAVGTVVHRRQDFALRRRRGRRRPAGPRSGGGC